MESLAKEAQVVKEAKQSVILKDSQLQQLRERIDEYEKNIRERDVKINELQSEKTQARINTSIQRKDIDRLKAELLSASTSRSNQKGILEDHEASVMATKKKNEELSQLLNKRDTQIEQLRQNVRELEKKIVLLESDRRPKKAREDIIPRPNSGFSKVPLSSTGKGSDPKPLPLRLKSGNVMNTVQPKLSNFLLGKSSRR